MSKYQNDTVGGTRTRVKEINIKVPVGELPIITVQEQEVVLLADGTEKEVGQGRRFSFQLDPTGSYEERNSETDELTNNVKTNAVLFNDVYSFIRQGQTNKDEEVVYSRANQPQS
jgi:hypothetical protein